MFFPNTPVKPWTRISGPRLVMPSTPLIHLVEFWNNCLLNQDLKPLSPPSSPPPQLFPPPQAFRSGRRVVSEPSLYKSARWWLKDARD